VLFSYVVGVFVDWRGAHVIPVCGALILFGLFCAAIGIGPYLRTTPARELHNLGKVKHTLGFLSALSGKPALLLSTVLVLQMGHSSYYAFYSVYLKELQWSTTEISLSWMVAVTAEVLFFFLLPKFVKTSSGYAMILQLSAILASLRWLMLSIVESPALIYCSQTLHAFSFAGVYVASIRLIYELLPDEYKDRGQGYVQAIGGGIGFLAGQLLCAYMATFLPTLAESYILFYVSSWISCVAVLLAFQVRRSVHTRC
jgi:PPP family 3-phenylpropionic acid transporter